MNKIKIAFCFLTYDKIIRYDIWNKFFNGIDIEKYTVIIHPKNINNWNYYTFPYTIVKDRINTTGKDNITIVKATLKLFNEAFKQNATHYIFLSQSCIPIYTFDILYNIVSNVKYSIISCIYNNKSERFNSLSNQLKQIVQLNNFVKQQPNMILIKEDIELLLKNDLTEHFKIMQCPDEHYFINILMNILKKNIIKKQTHFCNFNLNRTQALEYKYVDINFIKKIRDFGFIFMRKIKEDTIIDIDYLFN
jgi:hypothetical protein